MKTLTAIQKALIDLRNHPDMGEPEFAESATLLRMANDLAVVQGIKIESVGTTCTPAHALAVVSRYIAGVPADSSFLTATALAKVLGCRRPTIMKHLRAGRIPAINISTNAKPNYRFCLESEFSQRDLSSSQPISHMATLNNMGHVSGMLSDGTRSTRCMPTSPFHSLTTIQVQDCHHSKHFAICHVPQ